MAITPDRSARHHGLSTRLEVAFVLVCVLLWLLPAFSKPPQQKLVKNYALIFGTVFGPDGHVRYGVPVKIRRADKKKVLCEGISDHQGEFACRVPTGTADYIVWADIKVPKGENKPEAKVHVEKDERVDVGLHLKQ